MIKKHIVFRESSLIIKIVNLITVVCVASICNADSFYSSIGLGMPRYFVTGKAAGMGGAGIAVFDELAINRANPAGLKSYGLTRVAVEFDMESVDSEHESGNINSKYANANGFQFLTPIRRNISLGLGVALVTDSKYTLLIKGGSDDYSFSRRVEASGGLSRGFITVSYSPIEQIYIGISGQFNFGKYQEDWETEFDSDQYIDATDEITTHMRGTNVRLGLIVSPIKDLHLGLAYSNKTSLNAETTLKHGSGIETEWLDQPVTFPSMIFIGGSYLVKNQYLCAVDYVNQMWSKYDKAADLENSYRIGAGLELTPSREFLASYLKRISYRIGAYYTKHHIVSTNGESLSEIFATCGIGFPFHGNRGRVDLSLQVGQRGKLPEHPYKENIIRFVAALSGGERWFVRPQR